METAANQKLKREIEMGAREFYDIKREIDRLKERSLQVAEKVFRQMREISNAEIIIPLDENYNLRVRVKTSRTNKVDKDQMSADLNAKKKELKTEFLIKCVEDARLTHGRFLEYIYPEFNTKVEIKRVKVPKKKKKKGSE